MISLKKNIAIAVSRLLNSVSASHLRLKPGAKCCRSYAAEHSPKQRTKLAESQVMINTEFPYVRAIGGKPSGERSF